MMSNEEEKRCPLCAEEMDWTDQQFLPCQCGYQICVWCWHHIIDMAEKDETEGRCPACRTIYEKEKIVAMQANCKSTMTKNSCKKTKPPKAKPKVVNEVKKDLTNIRVIQRKMAYVIGLPLSLADEDVLLRKEYFGQYGKVTKVSLSRTAGGAIQQFINDTCSVYITYSKEEEALRCIQSVHGFVLEGRFLRASFGTAKYCHAWLKNMPCNNSACLYLHSFGADEDSFGKDEVAAVHTRSRVQEIVGSANNVVKRSGNVLPSPIEDTYNSTGSFTDKSAIRSSTSITDAAYGSTSSSSDINCTLPSQEKEGALAGSHKMTTFVDIVGRSNLTPPEIDGDILNLSSELSSVTINGDIHAGEPYSVPTLPKIPSTNHFGNGFSKIFPDKPLRKDSLLMASQESKDHRAFFFRPSYPSNISDDSGGSPIVDHHNPVHNHEEDAYLCQEMKFQNSAKSDRIYRSSKPFSNEEIVEHLRRIGDNDDNLTNGEENSVLDVVESSIISNIMSIDFGSYEDSLTMTNGLSELLDENDGLGNSSWSSLNSDHSGYSYVKQDGFANQIAAGSMLPDYRDNKEQYLCKPQHPVSRAQSLAPPGFSVPTRDPPPGFSTSERTSCISRASSGSRLANASSFSNNLLQQSSKRLNNSNNIDDVDFFDHTMLNSTQGNRTNDLKNPSFAMRPTGLSAFDDESRLWLLMQQSHQDSKFSQIFAPQNIPTHQELSYTGNMGNGSSSRLVDGHQNHTNPSFFTQMSHQKYANGHISNEVGIAEVERNERLGGGVNKYFPGYGDLMFSSGDVYTRVFGL